MSSYWCGTQGTGERGALALYRALVRGDREATIGAVKDRYVATDTISQSVGGYDETRRNFPVLNELGAIIGRRIDAMPNTFEIESEDEAAQEAVRAWASGVVTDKGGDLYSLAYGIARDQERDGNAVLIPYVEDGAFRVLLRDTEAMEVTLDPDTGRPVSYAFQYGDGEHVYRQTVDAESITTNGVAVPHGLPEIPVIVIPREDDHGSPVGVSGVAELLEAYLHFLWSSYLLNTANKYESHGVYCPDPSGDTGAFLPDASGSGRKQFRISPGMLYPISIKKVGGNINLDSLLEQVREAKATLYRIGRVRQDRQGADMRSGKAQLIDTAEMRDYAERKLGLVRAGLNRVVRMWATWAGLAPSVFLVTFPSLQDDDMAEQTKRAELALKAVEVFGVAVAAKIWQGAGLIDEDMDLSTMIAEIEARQEGQAAQAMERAAAMLGRTPEAVSDDGE